MAKDDRDPETLPPEGSGEKIEIMGDASQETSSRQNPTVRWEPRDLQFRPVLIMGIVVACFGAAHFWWTWHFFENRQRHEDTVKASTYPLAQQDSESLPREPRLDPLDELSTANAIDFREVESRREKLLHRLGPTSEKGFVHIPIEAAIKQLAEQSPTVKKPAAAAASKSNGLKNDGASNSGRTMRDLP